MKNRTRIWSAGAFACALVICGATPAIGTPCVHESPSIVGQGPEEGPAGAAFAEGIRLHRSDPTAAAVEYEEAIRLYTADGNDLKAAKVRNNLAAIHFQQGKNSEAIAEMKAAFVVIEKHFGTKHLETAKALENLAAMHMESGELESGEPYLDRALAAFEAALGPDDPGVVKRYQVHADYYERRGNHTRETVLREWLVEYSDRTAGRESDETAEALSALGYAAMRADDSTRAESAYKRALDIREKRHGRKSFAAAASLHNLGELAFKKGDNARAEELDRRALAIFEKEEGAEGPTVILVLADLGGVLSVQKKFDEAERLFRRALAAGEKVFGPDDTRLAHVLWNYAIMLREAGRTEEAERLEARARGLSGA